MIQVVVLNVILVLACGIRKQIIADYLDSAMEVINFLVTISFLKKLKCNKILHYMSYPGTRWSLERMN